MTNQYVNHEMPSTAEFLKMVVLYFRPMTPESFCLQVYLGSYYDGSSANPVIHPSMERTCLALGVTKEELLNIAHGLTQTVSAEDLEAGEKPDWAVQYDTADATRIMSYQPMDIDWIRAYRGKLKQDRMSMNYVKAAARYHKELKAGLAEAMSILAAAKTPSVFNDFMFSKYEYGTAPYRIWHRGRYGNIVGAKMQHNCQFTNKLIQDRSLAGAAELIEVRELTEDFVKQSFSAKLTFQEINEKFLLDGNYESIVDAIAEIEEGGWHTVRILERGDDMSGWEAVFTPTLAFHQLVWDMDFNAPGSLLTQWELANGFLPASETTQSVGGDAMTSLPVLGYHYLYGLRSARTGHFLSVGQTTQSLERRLRQHERSASNIEANKSMLSILRDATDRIEIVHFATVHHSIVAQKEMDLAQAMLKKGHAITNKILTVEENVPTVKLDARFYVGEYAGNSRAIQEDLKVQLKNYGKIVFMINKLPEAPTVAIDPECVLWLFETPELSDADENTIQETRTHEELMWEAEERGAYSEIAA